MQVRDGLVPLITELREKGTPPDDAWLKGNFSVEKQVGPTSDCPSRSNCVVPLCVGLCAVARFDALQMLCCVSVHARVVMLGAAGIGRVWQHQRHSVTQLAGAHGMQSLLFSEAVAAKNSQINTITICVLCVVSAGQDV